jgi:uncharacterized repeat protein (TIGR01451 family)
MHCAGTFRAALERGVRRSSGKAGSLTSAGGLLALGLALSLTSTHAYASTAGTVVSNTASLSFDVDDAGQTVTSNTVSIILAERLDVTVAADVPTKLAAVAGSENAVGFRVANGGNGAEVFTLVPNTTGEGASVLRIAADDDDNGIYDPAIDRQLQSAQLPLDPGQGQGLFVIVGGVQRQTKVSLGARSDTGTGAAGTIFGGKGQGGGDAFTGVTGAAATAETLLTLPSQEASLTKFQAISAPDGSTRAVSGAVITYTLAANFTAPVAGVEIDDPIPAGTAYVAGSLKIDDAALTDGADADAGRFDGSAIRVALGDVAAAGTRTIRFQVTIQ